MNSFYELVIDILESEFNAKRDQLRSDTSFRDLSFDSLNIIDLSLALDRKLDIEIDDEEVFRQETIGDLVKMLEALGGKV